MAISSLRDLKHSLLVELGEAGAQPLSDVIQVEFDLTEFQTSTKHYVFITSTAVQQPENSQESSEAVGKFP